MRNILFRGYSTVSREWIYGDLAHTTDRIVHISNEQCFVSVKPETIGQFTGSYDASGNKIFEHDIVKRVVNDKELIGIVEYADAAFGVRLTNGEGQFLCFFENCCEIIGNIHDNPELLSN